MQTIQASFQSLNLLMSINWDRLLYVATLVFALFFGAYVGNLLI